MPRSYSTVGLEKDDRRSGETSISLRRPADDFRLGDACITYIRCQAESQG